MTASTKLDPKACHKKRLRCSQRSNQGPPSSAALALPSLAPPALPHRRESSMSVLSGMESGLNWRSGGRDSVSTVGGLPGRHDVEQDFDEMSDVGSEFSANFWNWHSHPVNASFSMGVHREKDASESYAPTIRFREDDDDEENEAQILFPLHTPWSAVYIRPSMVAAAPRGSTTQVCSQDGESVDSHDTFYMVDKDVQFTNWVDKMMAPFVMTPQSLKRIVWDWVGNLIISYEAIVLPLLLLELQSDLLEYAAWSVRIFWTIDMLVGFCRSYYIREDMRSYEKRWLRCANNYVRTWFFPDFVMVAFDWLEVALRNLGMITAGRAGKLLKVSRMLRMMRVGKFVRTKAFEETATLFGEFYAKLGGIIVIFSVLKIIIGIVWVNHFFACCWFAIGKDGPPDINWITQSDLEDAPMHYVYATAFHWSLSQFAGTMEVIPHNMAERVFALFVLLFAFATSASVVGSLSSAFTQFNATKSPENAQLNMLKQYLYANGISPKLSVRIHRNAKFSLRQYKRQVPESEITILALISSSLKTELHYEINMPVLESHGLFLQCGEVNQVMMGKICHLALARINASKGDVLFNPGEIARNPAMYFLVSGHMVYRHHIIEEPMRLVNTGWASEAALWVDWCHRGALVASSDTSICVVRAARFMEVCMEFPNELVHMKKYAAEFANFLNSTHVDDLTDLEDPEMAVDFMARKAFRGERNSSDISDASSRMGGSFRRWSGTSAQNNETTMEHVRDLISSFFRRTRSPSRGSAKRSSSNSSILKRDSDMSARSSGMGGVESREFSGASDRVVAMPLEAADPFVKTRKSRFVSERPESLERG
eukprot:CAMPEP_0198581050 /NCGR_PEP_ID=MMETSP1462-20131121/123723_1 /TAXON_ID=1333877 /ORGANISM="Brandtodinium nutriculum, Strain RCC3387" /LENGTH=825 /DNA_ID=CAMNT_0044312415 /DNA_START=29 /DNA_END=2506 /DNA_ORIENTATION=-